MMTATETRSRPAGVDRKVVADLVGLLAGAGRAAGGPADQVENFAAAGYFPTPKQLEFHAAARAADAPGGPDEIGFGGGRGPGKSTAVFAQLALDDCRRRDGLKCLYLRKVGRAAREQLEDLRRKVLHSLPHDFNRSTSTVTFFNGSRIVMGHFRHESEIDNYLGLEYDIIAIEEATTLTAVKHQALRDSNRTSRTDWRPRIYNSTNSGGVGHGWYKQRFIMPYREKRERYTRFIPATLDDNPFLDSGYRRKIEENTGWRLRAYRYGDWDIAAGQFFTNWDHARHVVPPFPIPLDWLFWCALDYGFTHLTVALLFAMSNDGRIYIVDELTAQRQLVPQVADGIKAMLDRNSITVKSLQSFVAGSDVFSRRGTTLDTIADQYLTQGIMLTPANSDRINGWAQLMTLLGDAENNVPQKLFIFDRCKRLVDTLPVLEHNPNNPEDVLKANIDEEGNGGDDAADCARYGLMALPARRGGFAVRYA